jgi:hypothetical protein
MSVSVRISGIDDMKIRLNNLSEIHKFKLKTALDSVLIEIVNWIKQNHQSLGGWTDRTGALNNSISYKESEWGGNTLTGAVFAGKDYGIFVEFKEGHWVLSGGFDEFRPKIMGLLAERCGF